MANSSYAQQLTDHQWKNRLVLLLTEDPSHPAFQRQLAAFREDTKGVAARRLLVYQLTPEGHYQGLDQHPQWKKAGKLYDAYKQANAPFELVLIGLDGGVKRRSTDFLPLEDLFNTIDAMPMRRQEMRQQDDYR